MCVRKKMSARIRRNLPLLQQIKKADASTQRKLIKTCDRELLDCFCECSKNLLKGKVPLKKRQIDSLRRHKHSLKTLSLKKPSIKEKKKILQKGGFLGALLAPVLSFLTGILGSNAAR